MRWNYIQINVFLFLAAISFLFPSKFFSQSSDLVEVGRVFYGEVDYKGFSLSSETKIKIEGSGARYDEWDDRMDFFGWILDSKTREVVWHLFEDYDDAYDEDGMFDVNAQITLPAGDYEVYYTSNRRDGNRYFSFGSFLDNIFSSRKSKYRSRDRQKLYLTFSGPSGVFEGNSGEEVVDKMSRDAVVSMIRVGDDENYEKGFSLKAETKLRVYSLGEGRQREIFDYAWIYDAKTHKKVWEMDHWDADYAGGGRKNLLFNETLELPAGSYVVNYVSDDSHSFYEWNVYPPHDPQFWGITLFAESESDKANVIPFKEVEAIKPVLELTKIRDDEFVSEGMELKKDMDLRVLCIGEGSRDLVDYGWIINADTRETVWEMRDSRTEHAGGASKNRKIDEVISLKKGKYFVYYVTDDSHAFGDWNSSPPYEKNRWGITLWAVNENDKGSIDFFDDDDYRSENVIAEIIRVRDDEYESEEFTLNEDTKIRIFAIGEGDRGNMYDFGWIKNMDTGRIIWEMTYRKSDHAGGAKKNRMYNGVITLSKGNYRVFYESDDSHSFRDWNSSPPYDQDKYGITIMRE